MVEGQAGRAGAHLAPAGAARVPTRPGRGEAGRHEQVGHRQHRPARVAPLGPVGGDLLQVARRDDPRLLGELASRGVHRLLAGQQEAARQGRLALERLQGAVHHEHVEPCVDDRQRHDIDRDGHQQRGGGRGGGGVRGVHARSLSRQFDENGSPSLSSD